MCMFSVSEGNKHLPWINLAKFVSPYLLETAFEKNWQ